MCTQMNFVALTFCMHTELQNICQHGPNLCSYFIDCIHKLDLQTGLRAELETKRKQLRYNKHLYCTLSLLVHVYHKYILIN